MGTPQENLYHRRMKKFTTCFSLFLFLFVSAADTHPIDPHSQIKEKILRVQRSGPIVKEFTITGQDRAVFDFEVVRPGIMTAWLE